MSRPGGRKRRDELLERLAVAGRELSDAAVMFHTAVAERVGLGPSDWKTLGILERRGPLTAGELSERSGLAPPSVTGILDRLERDGWIERRRDPGDRRRVVVSLTGTPAVDLGAVFGGLMRRLGELYERYADEELALLAEFMSEAARRQVEATAELRSAESDQGRKVRRR